MKLFMKQKLSYRYRKQTCYQGEEGGGKIWEAGFDTYMPLYKKIDNNNLLYSIRYYRTTWYSVISYIRKESKRVIYV